MFQNPATLYSVNSLQISLGGMYNSRDARQEQNYAPVRYYPNLSLLLEDMTDAIPNPPHDPNPFSFYTSRDTVQRPYDNIGPNWSRSKNRSIPLQAMIAVPVLTGDFNIAAGIGAVEYANMDYYYQNNNVLSPSILSQRPLPVLRPTDSEPITVEWSQQIHSRKGSIQGYGFSLAGHIEEYNLSLGFSGMILDGSTDDYEQSVARGNLTFFSNAFRADSVYNHITKTGTSNFSGSEFTLSSILSGRYISIGFSLKLPNTVTRKYSMQVATDSSGTPSFSTIKGEDKLELKWRGMVGLSLTPKENLMLGIEYEFRPYKSFNYIDSDGNKTSPWLSASIFRVGAEYMVEPWLTLRGGMRGHSETFQSEGSQIEGEPVKSTIYSTGIGIIYSGIHLDVTYEYTNIKYQDIWTSAISKNSEKNHVVVANLSYEIPWSF